MFFVIVLIRVLIFFLMDFFSCLIFLCHILLTHSIFVFFWRGEFYSFIAMADARFTLYLVVEKRFQAPLEHDGILPMSIVNPGCYYIGLRECPIEAFIRAKRFYVHGTMSRDSHILLKINFSPAAVLQYISKAAGSGHAFASVLHKRTYPRDKEVDWGVWYFLEDLPLRCDDPLCASVVSSEWYELPEIYFDLYCSKQSAQNHISGMR